MIGRYKKVREVTEITCALPKLTYLLSTFLSFFVGYYLHHNTVPGVFEDFNKFCKTELELCVNFYWMYIFNFMKAIIFLRLWWSTIDSHNSTIYLWALYLAISWSSSSLAILYYESNPFDPDKPRCEVIGYAIASAKDFELYYLILLKYGFLALPFILSFLLLKERFLAKTKKTEETAKSNRKSK